MPEVSYRKPTPWGERSINTVTSGAIRNVASLTRTLIYVITGAWPDELSQELAPSTADIYPDAWADGGVIPIEDAAGRTVAIQKGLDDEIVLENLGQRPIKDGRPVCQRVKKTGHS